jgi:hypothetical protein
MPEKYSYGLVLHERESEAWLTIRKKNIKSLCQKYWFPWSQCKKALLKIKEMISKDFWKITSSKLPLADTFRLKVS